ncbi:conjugal transfer protein TrbD [Planctomycetales bacterium]|nr:conjugal transfer protein TrbD [Planctomycetales bacterium]GHS99026.1 conjugal transfer protein TrbD [Planctomycetales bacterium]GHT03710.1 conjugal transfer protein TrbD [Planctomycetales bacterium]
MSEAKNEDELLQYPICRAFNRPDLHQFLGCDREMVMVTGLLAGMSIFIGLTWFSVIFGICFWAGALVVLRMMAKADPLLRQVYLRNRRYKKYYAAYPTPFVEYRQFAEARLKDPWI